MTPHLDPCPFCGEKEKLKIYYFGYSPQAPCDCYNHPKPTPDTTRRTYDAWVECESCGVRTRDDYYPDATLAEVKAAAADKWNTRATP